MEKGRSDEFLRLGKHYMNSIQVRNFHAHFEVPSFVFELLWNWCLTSLPPAFFNPDYLFLTLFFLKANPPSWEVLASHFLLDIETVKKRIKDTLDIIDQVLPEV